MSWLHERVAAGRARAVRVGDRAEPWRPALLANVSEDVLWRLTYAVLDERETEGTVSFVLTPWPYVDDLGRVRHRREEPVDVAVPVAKWRDLVATRCVPEVLRGRSPRIGDAFAVLMARRGRSGLLNPVGPVIDVTADARDAARAAFYGAVAAPLDPAAAEVHAVPEDDHVAPPEEPAEWTEWVGSR
jgi:hypothetical protein